MSEHRPESLAGRIGAAMRAGRLEEAETLLEAYARDKPHRANEQFALASILLNRGHADRALPWLNRVVVLAPGHLEAQLILGRTLLRRGRALDAESPLRRALALKPDRFKTLASLGICLSRQQRWHEAIDLLARACALRPRDAGVRHEYGAALVALKRPDEAIVHLAEAASHDASWAQPRTAWARALYDKEEFSQAATLAKDALELDPASADAWYLMGLMGLIDYKRHRLASSCLRLWGALALRPALAEGHFFLGRSLNASNRHTEAVAAFACAIELRPKWAGAHHAKSVALWRLRQPHSAAASLIAAIGAKPSWALPRFRLANTHLDLGRMDEASINHAAAACLDPDSFGRHLADASLSAAIDGPVVSLEEHTRATSLPHLSLPREDVDGFSGSAPIAIALDDASVLGSEPLIVTSGGTMLAGGVSYNPRFAHNQIRHLTCGWFMCGHSRYTLSASATEFKSGTHLYVGGYENFGHWLINNVGRLVYVQQFPGLRELPLAMPDTVSADRRTLYALMGYNADRITPFRAGVITRFEKLWVPTTLWQEPADHRAHNMAVAVPRLLASLAKEFDPEAAGGDELLYLQRRNVSRRRVSNETKVAEVLVARGFQIVDPSTLPIVEQIRLVRRARVIVAPIGAASAIAVFARPGTTFIECKVEDIGMDVMPFICGAVSLTHIAVRCARAYTHERALFDDFRIPIADLEYALNQVDRAR